MCSRSLLILENLFVVARGTEQGQERLVRETVSQQYLTVGSGAASDCGAWNRGRIVDCVVLIVVFGTGAELPQLYSAYQAVRPGCGQRRGRPGD